MKERKMINLHPVTAAYLENLLARINKGRSKAGKRQLNRGDLIAMAIENLTIAQGVEK